MKNLLFLVALLFTMSLSAQLSTSVQVQTGGNYAVQNETAFTGVSTVAQFNVVNEIESDFGVELGVGVGYSSLASTFKTTVAQVSLGFTDNDFISGGIIVQYMDMNDLITTGLYGQFNYEVTPKIDVFVRGNVLVNVLEFQEIPTILNGSIGIKYNL